MIKYMGQMDREDIDHHTNRVQENIFLLVRVGALCGNIHVVDEPVWVTEHVLQNRYLQILYQILLNEFLSQ